MRDDFAVLILSHGRADKMRTVRTLEAGGYTGKTYIIIDDEDDTADEYLRRFGSSVIKFSKSEMDGKFDIGDNLDDRRVVVYARNKCHQIANELGLKYFLELDDDYTEIDYRWWDGERLKAGRCKQLDNLFEAMIHFLDVSGSITVAFAQGGDLIGGANRTFWKGLSRKAMNAFFCRVDRPFEFYGRINEDVNMYVMNNIWGNRLFTLMNVAVVQPQTQTTKSGLTDIYLDMGTYYKSFISVMYAPSCVKVTMMNTTHKRVHHTVSWDNCAPKILSEYWRKRGRAVA